MKFYYKYSPKKVLKFLQKNLEMPKENNTFVLIKSLLKHLTYEI